MAIYSFSLGCSDCCSVNGMGTIRKELFPSTVSLLSAIVTEKRGISVIDSSDARLTRVFLYVSDGMFPSMITALNRWR